MMGALCSSWWPLDWVAVAVVLLSMLYLYLTWKFNYWKDRGIPYVKPKLFFGSLKDAILMRKPLGHVYVDIYKELDGEPFGGYFKLREPALLIRDPEIIKTVLVKDFSSFHDVDFHVQVGADPLFGRNPFCLQGEEWKVVRSQLTPGFTVGKLRTMYPALEAVCRDMTCYLEIQTGSGGVEAKKLAAKLAAASVASCAFSIQCNPFTNPEADFWKAGTNFFTPSVRGVLEQLCIVTCPKLAAKLKIGMVPDSVADFFRKVMKSSIKYRQVTGDKRNDYLQLLIQLKEKYSPKNDDKSQPWIEKFTDEDVAAQAITFFTDGYETSSNALTYLLYELAMNPDHQLTLREEVDSVLLRHDGAITYDAVQEMTYLGMVLSETVRKYPPIMYLSRICTKPFDLPKRDGGVCRVEVGTTVIIPSTAIHNDPEVYPDPESFIPARFSEENVQSRHRYANVSFGEGPRMCLGRKYAESYVKVAVVSLISKFELRRSEKTPAFIRPHPEPLFLMPLDAVWIEFVKRDT